MSKYTIDVRFTNLDEAKSFLREKDYFYQESYSFKEDRCMLYKHKKYNKWLKVSSTFDYYTPNSMEMGTIWTLKTL